MTLVQSLLWWRLTPPWAAPDEPGHYLNAQLIAILDRPPSANDLTLPNLQNKLAAVEAPILASLLTHDWWHYNHRPTPTPLPDRFNRDPLLAASGIQAADEPPTFYLLPALALRLFPALAADPAQALRWLRLWPLLLHLAATLCALNLASSIWPHQPQRSFNLGLLVGTLPMVGFIGASFNNDTLALFWGALTFTLLAKQLVNRPPAPPPRLLLLGGILIAGPLIIDIGLFFLWPLALIAAIFFVGGSAPWQRRWAPLLLVALLAALLLLPAPRWAAGWRRSPPSSPTRASASLTLQPPPGASASLSQIIGGKQALALRGQPLHLQAQLIDDPNGRLTLDLSDNTHTTHLICTTPQTQPCQIGFTPHPSSTYLYLIASASTPIRFQLHLRDPDERDLLFNPAGALPDRLGSPLFTYLERKLPIPAGFFAHALAPGAWDAPAQFRYLLFAAFTWASFWGHFGWLDRPFPSPIYLLLAGCTLLATWGLFRSLVTALRNWRQRQTTTTDRLLGLSALACALVLIQIWLPMLGQSWQPQGRYLFPALLPIALLLLLGWEAALPPRWRPRLPFLLLPCLTALNIIALLVTLDH